MLICIHPVWVSIIKQKRLEVLTLFEPVQKFGEGTKTFTRGLITSSLVRVKRNNKRGGHDAQTTLALELYLSWDILIYQRSNNVSRHTVPIFSLVHLVKSVLKELCCMHFFWQNLQFKQNWVRGPQRKKCAFDKGWLREAFKKNHPKITHKTN